MHVLVRGEHHRHPGAPAEGHDHGTVCIREDRDHENQRRDIDPGMSGHVSQDVTQQL